jgi:hypothetical protein
MYLNISNLTKDSAVIANVIVVEGYKWIRIFIE